MIRHMTDYSKHLCQNKHSEIRVVVPDSNDTNLVKNLKCVIQEMTCFSPKARIAAEGVEERIDALAEQVCKQVQKTRIKHILLLLFIITSTL